jgi:ketosteroid isomerase-like protein
MPEQDAESVRQLLDRNIKALNAKEIEGILANQQPDAELVISRGLTLRGHEQLRQNTEALWAAFPDGAFSFAGQVVTEEAAAVELAFTGTNTAVLLPRHFDSRRAHLSKSFSRDGKGDKLVLRVGSRQA